MMKLQKWLLIGGVVILVGVAALAAFSFVIPYARAQGPMGWGDDGFGPGFGMGMGRGMMHGGDFGSGFGMGGGMMGIGGPENSLLSIAAEKLGMTTDDLIAELQAGKSIADVAQEKNVSVDTIVEAVVTSRSDRMSQMVTSGQMTQEQADAMLAQMKTHLTEQINTQGMPQGRGGFFGGPGGGHEGMGGMMGGRGDGNPLMVVAADKLGVTPQELFTELQAGKSIADVAKEKNVALDTIVEAALAPRTDRLNKLVADGQLTQAEVDNRLADLKVDIVDGLNQSRTAQNAGPDVTPDGSGGN
jgi:hypothetical protein